MTQTQAVQQQPLSAADLPASLTDMVEAIGLTNTLQVVKVYGGTRLFVPKQVHAQHRLANLLGMEQARRLSHHFAGESLTIPRLAAAMRARRNQEIIRRYDAGESARQLAQAYHLTDRQIYTILSSTV
ncbi:MAG: hypothetical protein H7837_08990 [Magnetococcus sp. MYC-9]